MTAARFPVNSDDRVLAGGLAEQAQAHPVRK
jgi:hypothetical protein